MSEYLANIEELLHHADTNRVMAFVFKKGCKYGYS